MRELELFKEKFKVETLRIASAEGWVLSLRPSQITLGAMIISSSRGAGKFKDIDKRQGGGFFELLALAEELSTEVFGAVRINAVALMMKDPIVHYHIVPRYATPVHFEDVEWIDKSWPGPPSFEDVSTGDELLKKIIDAVRVYMAAKLAKRKLKPWMAGTLRHYQHCDETFSREFETHLYAVGGTLLGGIRDHGFISHDKDMDVAYLSKASDIASVRREFVQRLIRLLDVGERVGIVDRAGILQRRHAKWWAEDGSYIDLFPACYDKKGYYCRPTFVRIKLPKEDLLPLRQIQFEGSSIFVPNKVENKIAAIFGDGWQTPDPKWVKPVFDGVEDMRSSFALTIGEARTILDHTKFDPDKAQLARVIDKWAGQIDQINAAKRKS